MSKKIATTIYITEDQQKDLKLLNDRTKVPVAEYIRQGIDMVLQRYDKHLPGQLEFKPLPLGKTVESSSAETQGTGRSGVIPE